MAMATQEWWPLCPRELAEAQPQKAAGMFLRLYTETATHAIWTRVPSCRRASTVPIPDCPHDIPEVPAPLQTTTSNPESMTAAAGAAGYHS